MQITSHRSDRAGQSRDQTDVRRAAPKQFHQRDRRISPRNFADAASSFAPAGQAIPWRMGLRQLLRRWGLTLPIEMWAHHSMTAENRLQQAKHCRALKRQVRDASAVREQTPVRSWRVGASKPTQSFTALQGKCFFGMPTCSVRKPGCLFERTHISGMRDLLAGLRAAITEATRLENLPRALWREPEFEPGPDVDR